MRAELAAAEKPRSDLTGTGAPNRHAPNSEAPSIDTPSTAPPAGGFTARDGTGAAPAAGGGARRAAEVAAAWEGLVRIRAVLLDGATGSPAPWERERPVHAVSLALEAAGCPPAGPGSAGYRVTPAAERGMAEIEWSAAESAAAALARCALLLGARGWQCTEHRTRDGRPFLVASPSR